MNTVAVADRKAVSNGPAVLRKQTIWLLTMLSLVVVLSVYYVTSEPLDQTASNSKEESKEASGSGSEGTNQLFDELRMTLADERSEAKSDLEDVITSAEATAEDKSEARDKMIFLEETAQKEEMLASLIESVGYEDVFVQINDTNDEVNIRVLAEELTKEQANKIMQLTESELGITQVAISHQS